METEYVTESNGATLVPKEPTPPKTFHLTMRRRQFNVFLRSIHDATDDSWKAAQIELKNGAVASPKFDRIEFFTDTLIGPIVAQREASTEDVHVTMQRPSDGIFRTADAILEELRNGSYPN